MDKPMEVNWLIKPEAAYVENPDADIQNILHALFGPATAGAAIGAAFKDTGTHNSGAPTATTHESNGPGSSTDIGTGSTGNSAAVGTAFGIGVASLLGSMLGIPAFAVQLGLNAISQHSAAQAHAAALQASQEAFTTAEHTADNAGNATGSGGLGGTGFGAAGFGAGFGVSAGGFGGDGMGGFSAGDSATAAAPSSGDAAAPGDSSGSSPGSGDGSSSGDGE